MVPSWKPSRVHDREQRKSKDQSTEKWASLTVWRKSLIFSGNGFTVIDCNGDLVYRVDNYMEQRPEEIVLMDGSGMPILTMCRSKKFGLIEYWLVYEGEVGKCLTKEPICCMGKHINVLQRSSINLFAQFYHIPLDKKREYKIEGSYTKRSCRILDESMKVVVEIKRKEDTKCGVSFGLEVFALLIRPGFNPNLAMAIVLLLDRICS